MDDIQLKAGILAGALPVLSSLLSVALIRALRPVLVRYAMARPNARSAHAVPTPQGGGIAVVAATLAVGAFAGLLLSFQAAAWASFGLLAAGALTLAVVGLVDDIRPLPPLPRLGLQLLCMSAVVLSLSEHVRVLPRLPISIERTMLVFGGAWFVNLTNFMDGMDWMTVAEFVPATAALGLFWALGFLSPVAGLLALALLGALLGFAPFNRPVARLFLGDVGSLPIGLIVAFCLIDLAAHGGLAATVLLPLYYLADSGITLLWRLRRGDKVWEAHRQHFYQVAVARGFSVKQVLARVFLGNLALAIVAAASLLQGGPSMAVAEVATGMLVVGLLLRSLARGRAARDLRKN